jgi:hypothetical protein
MAHVSTGGHPLTKSSPSVSRVRDDLGRIDDMNYATGDRVMHSQYGDGTILSVDEYHTKIKFDEHGPRTFISSRVVLAPSNTPAPAAPARTRRKAATAVAKTV